MAVCASVGLFVTEPWRVTLARPALRYLVVGKSGRYDGAFEVVGFVRGPWEDEALAL
jgi:hypothetical protein